MKTFSIIVCTLTLAVSVHASGIPTIDVDGESIERMEEISLLALKEEIKKEDYLYAGIKDNWHIFLRDDSYLDENIVGIFHDFFPFKLSAENVKVSIFRDLSEEKIVLCFMCDPVLEINIETKTILCQQDASRNPDKPGS